MWGKNKKINELVSSLSQSSSFEIDHDDLNFIQSCYTTREDNIFHLRIYLLQAIELNLATANGNPRALFQGMSGVELRTILAQVSQLERHRVDYEEILIEKYQNHSKSKSSNGSNSAGIKALAFKIFSKLHKLNMAYLAKIQAYFPRLYEVISSEQLAQNNQLKENAAALISSPGLTLGKVFALIAKTARSRLTKEITKLQNYQTSFSNLAQEPSKNNKNDRFFSEKLLQGLESFSYIISLQKKYYLRQNPQYKTLLSSKKSLITHSTHDTSKIENNLKQPAISIPAIITPKPPANPNVMYDDILNIDRKKAGENSGPSTSNNNLNAASNSNGTHAGQNVGGMYQKEYESIIEVILRNYEKHMKEWMIWNKYTNFRIKGFVTQSLSKHHLLTNRNPLFAKINPAFRISRKPSSIATPSGESNRIINNSHSQIEFQRFQPKYQIPTSNVLGSISLQKTVSQIQLPSTSSQSMQTTQLKADLGLISNQPPSSFTSLPQSSTKSQLHQKKFIMPTAPITLKSQSQFPVENIQITPSKGTITNSIGITSQQSIANKRFIPQQKSSSQIRLPTFAPEVHEEGECDKRSSSSSSSKDFTPINQNPISSLSHIKIPNQHRRSSQSSTHSFNNIIHRTPNGPSFDKFDNIEDPIQTEHSEIQNIQEAQSSSSKQNSEQEIKFDASLANKRYNRGSLQFSSMNNLESKEKPQLSIQQRNSVTGLSISKQTRYHPRLLSPNSQQQQNAQQQHQQQQQYQHHHIHHSSQQLFPHTKVQSKNQLQSIQNSYLQKSKQQAHIEDIEVMQKILFNSNLNFQLNTQFQVKGQHEQISQNQQRSQPMRGIEQSMLQSVQLPSTSMNNNNPSSIFINRGGIYSQNQSIRINKDTNSYHDDPLGIFSQKNNLPQSCITPPLRVSRANIQGASIASSQQFPNYLSYNIQTSSQATQLNSIERSNRKPDTSQFPPLFTNPIELLPRNTQDQMAEGNKNIGETPLKQNTSNMKGGYLSSISAREGKYSGSATQMTSHDLDESPHINNSNNNFIVTSNDMTQEINLKKLKQRSIQNKNASISQSSASMHSINRNNYPAALIPTSIAGSKSELPSLTEEQLAQQQLDNFTQANKSYMDEQLSLGYQEDPFSKTYQQKRNFVISPPKKILNHQKTEEIKWDKTKSQLIASKKGNHIFFQ